MNRIPLVIDVDTGTDDAICIISALLNQDKLDIKAFTTVCGNVTIDKTSRNTLNIVDHLGWDIRVAVGAEKPLVKQLKLAISHGNTGLGDVSVPETNRGFYDKSGSETIYDEALKAEGKLQILAVGPLTNLALAMNDHPDIVRLIEGITIMGGGLYGGNMTMTSEFNIYNDPEAAKIVFDSGIPLKMVGLDVTLKPKLPEWVFKKVKSLDNPYAALVYKILDFMRRRKDEIGGDDPNLHDVIALTALVEPEILEFKKFFMTVETEGVITRGMTVADFNNVENKEPNVSAAVDIKIERFWNWLVSILERA